jgi:hypothetical protein
MPLDFLRERLVSGLRSLRMTSTEMRISREPCSGDAMRIKVTEDW